MSEKYNICLDVGGTKVLGAIFDEKDKIIYRLKNAPRAAVPHRPTWKRSSSTWWKR